MMKQTLYFIPLVWATTVVALTSIETKPVIQIALLGLFVIICGLHRVFQNKAWKRYLMAGLVVFMFLAASLVSFIQLSLLLFAPVTPDGRPVMPIGQTFGGIVLGSVVCILVSRLYFAWLKPNLRAELIWAYATVVVLGIAITIDCLFLDSFTMCCKGF